MDKKKENKPDKWADASVGVAGNRLFLYLTGFFSGMSVMAIELGASRMLAPYFSSSQIVWTVIIGTIMIAMAIGNVWGGRSADRHPGAPGYLYARLLLVAVWCGLTPFLGKYVIAGVTLFLALFVKSQFLVIASFLSCILLFVFPLMLLGTVTPCLMKLATVNLSGNGKVVGELEAVGTIGSIIGTFLPTFVTIPTVGTAKTFLIFASVLALLSLIYFISAGIKHIFCGVAAGLLIVASIVPIPYRFAFWETELAYEGESIYNYLQVKENEDSIILSTNVAFGVQSITPKTGTLTGLYYDTALAANVMAENCDEILILGLGTGTYASLCTRYFPDANVTGIEIDEKIVDLAKTYFGLPESVDAIVGDGRSWLSLSGRTFDVIMVDAYQDITIPPQMSSVEFFTEVKNHLNPGGVMVVNLNMRSEEGDSITQYLSETVASVFPGVYGAKVPGCSNMELFASENTDISERLATLVVRGEVPEDLSTLYGNVWKRLFEVEPGTHILTDDKAPVEVLGMKLLDKMISEELAFIQDLIREEGLFGAIKEISN